VCCKVRLKEKLLSSPRELRDEIGSLIWREDYTVCATHDVWLDSCLCSIDVPATVASAGLQGDWNSTERRSEFIVESPPSEGHTQPPPFSLTRRRRSLAAVALVR
jgi:hypothetical protein